MLSFESIKFALECKGLSIGCDGKINMFNIRKFSLEAGSSEGQDKRRFYVGTVTIRRTRIESGI